MTGNSHTTVNCAKCGQLLTHETDSPNCRYFADQRGRFIVDPASMFPDPESASTEFPKSDEH